MKIHFRTTMYLGSDSVDVYYYTYGEVHREGGYIYYSQKGAIINPLCDKIFFKLRTGKHAMGKEFGELYAPITEEEYLMGCIN